MSVLFCQSTDRQQHKNLRKLRESQFFLSNSKASKSPNIRNWNWKHIAKKWNKLWKRWKSNLNRKWKCPKMLHNAQNHFQSHDKINGQVSKIGRYNFLNLTKCSFGRGQIILIGIWRMCRENSTITMISRFSVEKLPLRFLKASLGQPAWCAVCRRWCRARSTG